MKKRFVILGLLLVGLTLFVGCSKVDVENENKTKDGNLSIDTSNEDINKKSTSDIPEKIGDYNLSKVHEFSNERGDYTDIMYVNQNDKNDKITISLIVGDKEGIREWAIDYYDSNLACDTKYGTIICESEDRNTVFAWFPATKYQHVYFQKIDHKLVEENEVFVFFVEEYGINSDEIDYLVPTTYVTVTE